VDVSFWHALKAKKLDVLKVEDMPLPIRGSYVPAAGTKAENGSLMFLDFSAFDIESELPYGAVSCPGTLINVNTLEDFKKMDRKAILFQYGKLILEDIRSGRSSSKPSLLCRFILTTFADLKSHKFHYWFAFPVLKGFKFTLVQPSTLFSDAFSDDQICFFHQMFEDWSKKESKGEYGITPVQISKDLCHIVSWEHFGAHKTSDLFIAFVDASSNSKAPSWNLRNALVMSSMVYNVKQVRVICIRNLTDMRSSMIFHVRTDGEIVDTPDFSGWEPASTGRLTSRVIDLSALLDPIELAKSSVTLNIRLMRWRLMPSLQVDEIANTKCLLLGAGTLGCAVAQVLLGWGVKTISFVDNGRVSYSNPVRQFLYDFKDCQDGGRWKVEAAAERLIEIFPGSNPSAHVLSIPMPGHPIPESEMDKFLNDFERLCKLIQSHDVIFLLTDSRESRWLPTVLCTAHKKPLINTALGFDTFQVIRSGQGIDCPERLGCSFCSDVCAPSDVSSLLCSCLRR
jgi:ubiquitin-like modifier-activating enzyme ATG7